MKKIFVTLLALLALCACSSDPDPIDRQAYEAKKAFEAMYLKHMYGQWYGSLTSDDGRTSNECSLSLSEKNKFKRTVSLKEQPSGHTIRTSTDEGTWYVAMLREDDGKLKSFVCLETGKNSANKQYVPCTGADETTLYISLPPFDKLHKIK